MTSRPRTLFSSLQSFAPPLVILAVTLVFIVSARAYASASAAVPLLVGYSLIVLIGLDIVSRTETRPGEIVRKLLNPGSKGPVLTSDEPASARHELVAIGWVAAFTAAVMLFGILLSVPGYIAAYMIIQGRKSVKLSLSVAGATTLFLWLGFELFLSIPLYRGLMFEE
jgi:hypothetical protein